MPLVPTETIHLSINGKAACDGRPLTGDRDSGDCPDAEVCRTCLALQWHLRRERLLSLARDL
jgi:hypothetical protein